MKALFCGLGSIGQRHLRNLRTILGSEVEVLAYRGRGQDYVLNPDMTIRSGASLADTYGIRSLTSLDEALAEEPDMVFITNPNSLHMPVALAAARAGCHLFIEKPVSNSTEGLNELVQLVERNRLTAFVAYQFRFHPGLALLKSFVEQGRFGRLTSAHIVNAEHLPDWHPYEDYRETHPARSALGGGCLNIQTHELDYAVWLFGVPKKIFAVGGHLSRLEVDVEDSVDLLMHCQSDGRPLPVHIHLDYLQRPPQRLCEITGDAGKARYDYYANQVEFYEMASRTPQVYGLDGFDRNQMFIDEMKHFLDCVRGETLPLINLRDGIRSLKLSLAAHESLRSGYAVEVTDDW